MRLFENWEVRKVSGHEMVEVTGQWRRLLTKYRIVRWAGYSVNHKQNNVNHKIGYMYLKFNEISLSFSFPVVYIRSLKPGNRLGFRLLLDY